MSILPAMKKTHVDQDVFIIGAGLSGVNAAYQISRQCPQSSYAILEARSSMGGTWDLFKYPGVRSDSDMYTLGFPFRPWLENKVMADGQSILRYIKSTAEEYGIAAKVRYGHKIIAADWSSDKKIWRLRIEKGEAKQNIELTCRFLIMCSGYYDYDEGHCPEFKGMDSFKGIFVHPQKWDPKLKYASKKIIVIGSGATAITLIPKLAETAAHVTMLQRSPSYIAAIPQIDPVANWLRAKLPSQAAHSLIRWKNIFYGMYVFNFCQLFPVKARNKLVALMQRRSRATNEEMKHFTPSYRPWEQRLCMDPDAHFFKALRSKKASIVTDEIAHFTATGIQLKSGEFLAADIVVSATGLKIKFLAGVKLSIDAQPIDISKTSPYKASMFSGIPNFAMVFGYTNASWTLKCSLTSEWIARLIKYMQRKNFQVVCPNQPPAMATTNLLNFSSGYVKRAEHLLPKQGKKQPWKVNQNYILDIFAYRVRPLADKGLDFKQ